MKISTDMEPQDIAQAVFQTVIDHPDRLLLAAMIIGKMTGSMAAVMGDADVVKFLRFSANGIEADDASRARPN